MRRDLIALVYEVRNDAKLDAASSQEIEAFRDDMLDCLSWLKSRGRASVSPTGIKNWLPAADTKKASIPKRHDALLFLSHYLGWIEKRHRLSHASQQTRRTELLDYLAGKLQANLGSSNGATPGPESEGTDQERALLDDPAVQAAVKTIVYTSSRNPRSERNDLFRGSRKDASDRSYYLLFRYSTSSNNIVKTFIVINAPEEGSDTFTYRHVIWCRPPDASRASARMRASIFRECEGVIAKFPSSYYFVGYNFTVPIDRLSNPEGYIVSRQRNREMPQGLGLLAIEYEGIRRSPGLFSGVTMTLAAADQPVVARVAMLHLGTKSAAQLEIKDTHVKPGELRASELAGDLAQVIGRLKRGGKELSEEIEAMLKKPNWEQTGLRKLEREIVDMIDMTPAAFRAKHARSKTYGAVESVGFTSAERPRN